jgi:hypothetical protein
MKVRAPGRYIYLTTDGQLECPGCDRPLPALETGQSVQCPKCKGHVKRTQDTLLAYDNHPIVMNGIRLPIGERKKREKPLRAVPDADK